MGTGWVGGLAAYRGTRVRGTHTSSYDTLRYPTASPRCLSPSPYSPHTWGWGGVLGGARTTGSPQTLAAQPLTPQHHVAPSLSGDAWGTDKAARRPGQGSGEGADDGNIAQKGQSGSAKGAGEAGGRQAILQPGPT